MVTCTGYCVRDYYSNTYGTDHILSITSGNYFLQQLTYSSAVTSRSGSVRFRDTFSRTLNRTLGSGSEIGEHRTGPEPDR